MHAHSEVKESRGRKEREKNDMHQKHRMHLNIMYRQKWIVANALHS